MAHPKELEAFNARLLTAMRNAGVRGPADLARITGLNKVTAGSYVRGDRFASLEACMNIGRVLNVNPMWLYSGKDQVPDTVFRGAKRQEFTKPEKSTEIIPQANAEILPKQPIHTDTVNYTKRIPLYSCALAGPDGSVSIGGSVMEMIDAPAPIASVQDAYAVRVAGESMEPRYYSGEIVYIHPTMPIRRGDFVLAQIAEDGNEGAIQGYIKRFVSIDDKRLIVEQLNPDKEMVFPRNRVRSVQKIVLAG